ncbi:hypothetical protein [Candidatus Liberibacter brunswickensis]|uniref:hypothetical protein n=1 Tax=Candidatus Liberibacter brunswickensis TaxID=1968796 RepID=UPI002FDF76E0
MINKKHIILIIIILIFGIILSFYFKHQKVFVPQNYILPFSEKSVWKWKDDVTFSKCNENEQAISICLIELIKKTGGSKDALQAAEFLAKEKEDNPAYISSYRKEGLVGLVEVEYPYRANSTTGTLLIPAVGDHIIYVDDDINIDNIYKSSSITKEFALKNPNIDPYIPGMFIKSNHNDKFIELIFSYPLRNCHSCQDIAFIYITYQFTLEGAYIGKKISSISYP